MVNKSKISLSRSLAISFETNHIALRKSLDRKNKKPPTTEEEKKKLNLTLFEFLRSQK